MCYEKSVNIFEQNMRERQKVQCSSVKGLQEGIARQKATVIKENAKYSFVDLGKIQYQFVHSPNFKKVLAGAPRGAMHDNATSAVDRSLNPFCCSCTHPPHSPPSSTAASRLRFYTITEKGEASVDPAVVRGCYLWFYLLYNQSCGLSQKLNPLL